MQGFEKMGKGGGEAEEELKKGRRGRADKEGGIGEGGMGGYGRE